MLVKGATGDNYIINIPVQPPMLDIGVVIDVYVLLEYAHTEHWSHMCGIVC